MIYPSYKEWSNDGHYKDIKRIEVFCFEGMRNELKSVCLVSKKKHAKEYREEIYFQFRLNVKGDIFRETFTYSPKFEYSEKGYLEAIDWFKKWKELKLKTIACQNAEKELFNDREKK